MAPLRMEVGPAQACAVKVVVHLPIKGKFVAPSRAHPDLCARILPNNGRDPSRYGGSVPFHEFAPDRPNWRFHARKESELSISLYNDEREGRALRSIGLPFLSGESENDSSRTQSSKESSSLMVSLSAPLAPVEGSALPPTAAHIMGSNRGQAGLTRWMTLIRIKDITTAMKKTKKRLRIPLSGPFKQK
ncbi:hypothetical protein F2Q69_00052961 [Brassica cretica]|uniref:Uncharacterized protein n=1 Tax=Brassica cretica TaxID=69181 RepID=A0A8S9N452_BRACR|nr:hypothetical protein F2Q69_00052961 [Brassica cretica]